MIFNIYILSMIKWNKIRYDGFIYNNMNLDMIFNIYIYMLFMITRNKIRHGDFIYNNMNLDIIFYMKWTWT